MFIKYVENYLHQKMNIIGSEYKRMCTGIYNQLQFYNVSQ
jgi:hypothetical protein